MKKGIILLVFSVLFTFSSVAFANLGDSKAAVQSQYGDYRLIIDTDNQLWTKADWDEKGYKRAHAASYRYSFSRQGLGVQLDVMYNTDKPDAIVITQRFTPDMPIKIKDLKSYFPEIYALTKAPKAKYFATYSALSRNFQEHESPVRMGVLIKELTNGKLGYYYPLVAFNIQDEGRLVKNIEYINEDIYIREFTVERVSQSAAGSADWKSIKNYFN